MTWLGGQLEGLRIREGLLLAGGVQQAVHGGAGAAVHGVQQHPWPPLRGRSSLQLLAALKTVRQEHAERLTIALQQQLQREGQQHVREVTALQQQLQQQRQQNQPALAAASRCHTQKITAARQGRIQTGSVMERLKYFMEDDFFEIKALFLAMSVCVTDGLLVDAVLRVNNVPPAKTRYNGWSTRI